MLETLGINAIGAFAILAFITVLLVFESVYLLWRARHGPAAQRLNRRLDAVSSSGQKQHVLIHKDRALSDVAALNRWMVSRPFATSLQRRLEQAGSSWKASQLIFFTVFAGLIGVLLMQALRVQLEFAFAGVLAIASLPMAFVELKRKRRLAKLENQLPDALDFLTRSLRAGHSFSSALVMAGEELLEPISAEFKTTDDEITFGVSLEQALTNLGERIPLTDVRYFVVAVLIQRESGGNLTEVLGNLSRLIRERQKLMSRIRVLSADGRFSSWILVLMPFALGWLMYLINPEFMSLLWTDPIGQSILKTLGVMMVLGILILRRIIRIRV